MRCAVFGLCSLFLFVTPMGAQTSPCAGAQTTVQIVTAASAVLMTQPQYAATFNGQPVLTDVDVSAFPKGANPATTPPVSGVTIAKSALVLVDAASACYRAVVPFLGLVDPNVEYDLRVRNRGTAFAPDGTFSLQFGAWSSVSVPFGRSAPAAAPTALRITP